MEDKDLSRDLNYVLGQIVERLNTNDIVHQELKTALVHIDTKLDLCVIDQAVLKTKASMWGAIMGIVASVCTAVFIKLFIK